MSSKEYRLESLRRVAERLRKIEGDTFAANMARRLENEIAEAQANASQPADNTPQWDWSRSDYVSVAV